MRRSMKQLWKTIYLLLLCVLVPATLIACSGNVTTDNPSNTGASPSPSGTETQSPSAAPSATEAASPGTENNSESLAKAYADYFLVGTIYTPSSTSGLDKTILLNNFNVITPENLMKPQYMQPSEGSFSFTDSDKMVQFAQDNGLKVVGHTLVWHQQSGNWLGKNVTRDEAIEQLHSHITTIAGKYKGKIMAWDVVNEAVNDGVTLPTNGDWTKCLRNTQWLESIGPDYLSMAFKFAHEADPNAKLYYNDYNMNDKKKAQIVHAMVKDLKAQGVPIHGIGMQGHYAVNTVVGTVKDSLKLFSELGVEVSITELDVTVSGASETGLTEDEEIAQAIVYAKLFKIFKEYSDIIERVTFWGTLDSTSWRAKQFPCLFNGDYTPKEAYKAILDPDSYLKEHVSVNTGERKAVKALYGTPVIDGEIDELWNKCEEAAVDKQITAWQGATGKVRLLWDETHLYALFEVKDSVLNKQSVNAYEQDSIEIFLDQNNDKQSSYGPDDGQYRVNFNGEESFGTIPETPGFTSAAKRTATGYLVELAIPLMKEAKPGTMMGFDAQVNDSNDQGIRQGIAKLFDTTDSTWSSMENVGNMIMVKE